MFKAPLSFPRHSDTHSLRSWAPASAGTAASRRDAMDSIQNVHDVVVPVPLGVVLGW
jgi:hypothetical protein